MEDEDFDEEEVWDMLSGKKDESPRGKVSPPSSPPSRRAPSSSGAAAFVQKSAPLNIHANPKIDASEDEDDDDEGRLLPHEWVARKLEKSGISSFSVCEGAGRTLKGRDLSKVRNAVLIKTGFIE